MNLKAMEPYKTLTRVSETELTERRSVFFGCAAPAPDEQTALDFINAARKKHSDATHNVYAYLLRGSISRFSDDGEPHGTAGLPVLEVLRKENVVDAVIVVTRWFGGILLGTGGLVRAYAASAKLALDAAVPHMLLPHAVFGIACGYTDYQKLSRIFARFGVTEEAPAFGAAVTLTALCPESEFAALSAALTEATGGRVSPERTGTEYR